MKQEDGLAPRFCSKQLAILVSSSLDLSQDGWNERNKHDHARDWSRLERGIYQWSREHIYTASKSAHGVDLCRSKEQAVRRHTFPNLYED